VAEIRTVKEARLGLAALRKMYEWIMQIALAIEIAR
jgi:hypothetical protein